MSSRTGTWTIESRAWEVGDSGPLHVAVLIIDLVNSTDFASVMGLREYAAFSDAFSQTATMTCRHFFRSNPKKYGASGQHFAFSVRGDELVVFLHTNRPHDDVYQLVSLAIALKCAWLTESFNLERIESGRPSVELAAGIHSGPVWATRTEAGFDLSGFAVNLAKRVESVSREGERFRIFVSDPAFKLINLRMRNLIFGPRRVLDLKGVSSTVGVYELVDGFVNPSRRMPPEFAARFTEAARRALSTNTFDLWIHSCLQVAEGSGNDIISDECMSFCKRVLNIDPRNPVALFYQAEAERDRGNLETARLFLEDLTHFWPTLGDGWLARARLHKRLGEGDDARQCVLQARRHGVGSEEEALPDDPP